MRDGGDDNQHDQEDDTHGPCKVTKHNAHTIYIHSAIVTGTYAIYRTRTPLICKCGLHDKDTLLF
ncbi:hypothetical protein B0F90DRAFT_1715269, partial [Multifurca ochricompacta]